MLLLRERVVATGAERDLRDRYSVDYTVRLEGVVVPGSNDAHAHPTMTAENLLRVDCSPDVAVDEPTLAGLLREEKARTPDGGWVVGSRYDPSKTSDGRVIDRWYLDRVTGDTPTLVIHVAVHWGVLNSAGLARAGYTDDSVDPRDGKLGRAGDGGLNGIVYEQALFDVVYPALARRPTVVSAATLEQRLGGLRRTLEMFHAAGLTSVCDALCGPEDMRLLSAARANGHLTMRTGMLLAYPHYDALEALGVRSGFGDEHLRLVGIKAFVDGACAGGNCLVEEPFEGTDDHGMQIMGTGELEDLVVRTTRDGNVLAVHANGDRAIRLLLDAHEKAASSAKSRPRHRIEHCSLIDEDLLARIRDLGLVAVPFGSYARFHGDKLPGYYGELRLERMFAHRSMLDAGIRVAGSSDYPCGPVEPLAALASCVTRRSLDGSLIGGSQRITLDEALRLYTIGSAYASGDEHHKGRLAPGMLADFVELSDDPFETPPEQLPELAVRSTWVGSRCVYERH